MSASATPRADQCVILAGGLGARLGSLAGDRPKPLALVGGRPFLDHLLIRTRRLGFGKILLLAGHRSDAMLTYAKSRSTSEMTIDVSVEPGPLGTAGALRFAASLLDERFVMLNGDSLFDFNWRRLEAVSATFEAAMALRWADDASRFGVVSLEGERVATFKSAGDGGGGLINGGVYVFSKTIAAAVPERGSLEGEVFPGLAARRALAGTRFDGFFIDIGVPTDFERAQTAVPDRERRDALFVVAEQGRNQHDPVDLDDVVAALSAANHAGCFAFLVAPDARTPPDPGLLSRLGAEGVFVDDVLAAPAVATLDDGARALCLRRAAESRGWAIAEARGLTWSPGAAPPGR